MRILTWLKRWETVQPCKDPRADEEETDLPSSSKKTGSRKWKGKENGRCCYTAYLAIAMTLQPLKCSTADSYLALQLWPSGGTAADAGSRASSFGGGKPRSFGVEAI